MYRAMLLSLSPRTRVASLNTFRVLDQRGRYWAVIEAVLMDNHGDALLPPYPFLARLLHREQITSLDLTSGAISSKKNNRYYNDTESA